MLLFLNIDFLQFGWIDAIDIFFTALLFYALYNLIKGSVAIRILIGGLIIMLVYWLFDALNMQLLSSVLGQFVNVGVVAIIVIFQAEIKKFLFLLGKGEIVSLQKILQKIFAIRRSKVNIPIDIFMEAVQMLSSTKTGALIAFAKGRDLKFYADTGDALDALPSKRLINTIFFKNSPLHDGALIVDRNGRLIAANCILPVSENMNLPPNLGLRHRSALGLSEQTDAVVLVVSEETGLVSLAHNGQIKRGLSYLELRRTLIEWLTAEDEEEVEEAQTEEQKDFSDMDTTLVSAQVKKN
ncbi:MAG: diadenylate cyclase CdaA [Microscillaceae bacterium]|nr:diadenylate cyclase CdaA [Microscillaceae bacterium]MDW8460310.1 diadenylate cyclase CdaA [Cytophagales bacterium]